MRQITGVFKLEIVQNWRVKLRSYSIWSIMLSLFLFLLPEGWYSWTGEIIFDPYRVGQAALFFGVFGLVGWFVDQKVPSLWRTFKVALLSGAITALIWLVMAAPSWAMGQVNEGIQPPSPPVAQSGLPTWEETAAYAVPLIKQWEGTGPTFECSESASGVCVRAYLDTIADPDLPTICFGETSHTGTRVAIGDTRTIEECEAGLSRIARDRYWSHYREGVTIATMPAQVDAAMTDLAWNVGPGAVLGSSALVALNEGDFADACRRYTFWNRAGGQVVRGLVNRRAAGYAVCMEGVAAWG